MTDRIEDDIHPVVSFDDICIEGLKTSTSSQAITKSVTLNDPMMLQWIQSNEKENTADVAARHFIYEDGARYPEDYIEIIEKNGLYEDALCLDPYVF